MRRRKRILIAATLMAVGLRPVMGRAHRGATAFDDEFEFEFDDFRSAHR
jgi:hypothetical protein